MCCRLPLLCEGNLIMLTVVCVSGHCLCVALCVCLSCVLRFSVFVLFSKVLSDFFSVLL